MSFLHVAALAAMLLVIAPIAAHLLRRRRAQDQPFPPAILVPPSPPAARRRSRLEDRWLFGLRALAIVALALLGASPFVRCSRLSLGRNAGASVAIAIVLDDSMSMKASASGGRSRFATALKDASDLVSGAREGDAVGLFLAGSPARVALAPTTDLATASKAVEAASPSDRATDLDGAIALARAALRDLPHADKRIVVLSDRTDARPDAPPLGEGMDVALWAPPRGLDQPAADCAIVRADRRSATIFARVVCSGAEPARGRSLEARVEGRTVASRPLPSLPDAPVTATDLSLTLDNAADQPDVVALVGPADAIADDDQAPVGTTSASLSIAVVSDRGNAAVATGGPPPVEQAIEALETGASVRPLPVVPETADELAPHAAIIIDDPPGLTPEARQALQTWMARGGVGMVALGPRAASAPIGSSLEPFISGASRWDPRSPAGIDVSSAAILGPSAEGLVDLKPQGRSLFDSNGRSGLEVLVRWSDAAPWLARRQVGRGQAFALSLPLGAEQNELVVRPAFLALVDHVIETARARGSARRIDVGASWLVDESRSLEVRNRFGLVASELRDGKRRVTPALAGRYDLRIDGAIDTRFAQVPERELDLRPRAIAQSALRSDLGGTSSSVDISRYIAFLLLALVAAEMAARGVMAVRDRKREAA